jgi:hypothetical protein
LGSRGDRNKAFSVAGNRSCAEWASPEAVVVEPELVERRR